MYACVKRYLCDCTGCVRVWMCASVRVCLCEGVDVYLCEGVPV